MARTTTHWGTYDVEVAAGRIVAVEPLADDPDPSPIADNLLDGPLHPGVDLSHSACDSTLQGRAIDLGHGIHLGSGLIGHLVALPAHGIAFVNGGQ